MFIKKWTTFSYSKKNIKAALKAFLSGHQRFTFHLTASGKILLQHRGAQPQGIDVQLMLPPAAVGILEI